MSEFTYRPPDTLLQTARGSADEYSKITEEKREEEYTRVEIGKSGLTREEREAIEEERLRELRLAQPSAADFHGTGHEDYIPPVSSTQRFEHSDQFGSALDSGYQPSSGWDYETDTPSTSYYSYFGEPSLEELDKGNEQINELLSKDVWSAEERANLNKLKKDWNAGEIDPFSLNVKEMYATANARYRTDREKELDKYGITSYSSGDANSLGEAKVYADAVYMEYLYSQRETAKGDDLAYINRLIAEGAPNFSTAEEIKKYHNADKTRGGEYFKIAADLQGLVVRDFLDRSQNLATDMQDLSYSGETFRVGKDSTAYPITLNTGTIVGAPPPKDVINVGEFGSYSNYSYDIPEKSTFSEIIDIGLKGLSIVQPQFAPTIAGIQAIATGGDLDDALMAAGTSWVSNKIKNIAEPEIAKVFSDVGINVYELPESVQKVLFDTTTDVLEGDSFKEALKENIAKETLSPLAEPIEEVFEDLGDAIPDALKAPVEFVADKLEPVIDVIDEGVDYIGEQYVDPALKVAEEFVEPVVGAVQEVTEPVIETVQEVGRDVDKEVIQPALNVVQEVTEPIINTFDEALDTFGEKVVDPALQAGSDVLSDVEDVVKEGGRLLDDLINWENLAMGMLGSELIGQTGQPSYVSSVSTATPTESLFDKELFKFDTEIKSTQEMLSPMMNLRRYG